MSKNTSPRYTANGFSHASLLKKAKSLKKPGAISGNEARNHVAREIGYRSWGAILKEAHCEARDHFFHRGFSNKSIFQSSFQDFLEKKSLEDTLQNYRYFLVEQEKLEALLRRKDPRADTKIINVDSAIKELQIRIRDLGPEGFLPQSLPTYLLNSLLSGLEVLLEDPGKIENLEAGNDDIFLYRTIIDIVLQLLAVRELLKNPKHSNSFEFSDSELVQGMELYHMNLSFESIRRRTKMEISFPTLEDLLDINSQRTVKFPDEALEFFKSKYKPE